MKTKFAYVKHDVMYRQGCRRCQQCQCWKDDVQYVDAGLRRKELCGKCRGANGGAV